MSTYVSSDYQAPSPFAQSLLSVLPHLPPDTRSGLCLELLLPHGNVLKFVQRALHLPANHQIINDLFSQIVILDAHGDRDALDQLHRIADDGNSKAQYSLGLKYKSGWSSVTQDIEKARVYFQLAASQGHEASQFLLDYMDAHQDT